MKKLLILMILFLIAISANAQILFDNVEMGMSKDEICESSNFDDLYASMNYREGPYGRYKEYRDSYSEKRVDVEGKFKIHEELGLYEFSLVINTLYEDSELFLNMKKYLDEKYNIVENGRGVVFDDGNGFIVELKRLVGYQVNILFKLDIEKKNEELLAQETERIEEAENLAIEAEIQKISQFNEELVRIASGELVLDKTDMVDIQGGTFKQYTVDGEMYFEHTISDFMLGKYEVTYDLWYRIYRWAIQNGYEDFGFEKIERKRYFWREGGGKNTPSYIDSPEEPTEGKDFPVIKIDFASAIVWCNAYSEFMNLEPVYKYGPHVIRGTNGKWEIAIERVVCDWKANGFRLPTEGEWQYAASYIDGENWIPYNYASGAKTFFNDNNDADFDMNEDGPAENNRVAWYDLPYENDAYEVGLKEPNSLGTYDMSGNVWEWCWDLYGDYPENSKNNYHGPDTADGNSRIIRGGGADNWHREESPYLTVSYRASGTRGDFQFSLSGLRLARNK